MAENNKAGREPISTVTLGQDVCALVWSESPCQAGHYNILPENFDYDNAAAWAFDSWDAEITGTAVISQFEKIAGGTGNLVSTVLDLEHVFEGDVYFSGQVSQESGSVNEFRIIVETVAGFSDAVVLMDTASGENGRDEDPFDSFVVSAGDIGGYHKFEGRIAAANIKSSFGIQWEFLNSGATPAVGVEIRIFGLQAAAHADQAAITTRGVPFLPFTTERCFNTRATCQDPANYDRDTLPLNFIKDRSPSLKDGYYIPSLQSVSIGAARINPGGANKSTSPLGRRATISVRLQDHPHDDRLVDQYTDTRSYTPLERSTFWAKWRARNPYYLHRALTFNSGYLLDAAMVDPITRDFVITGFSGPDSDGNVSIEGKDVLSLAEDTKAQAPIISTGELLADITVGAVSATLSPAGIGDLEYLTSGHIRVEKEVMQYTRVADVLTLVTRGDFGTTADEHDAGSAVQDCLVYDAEAPQDILEDLLLNYAGLPAAVLDKVQWDAEALSFLPRLYSAIISEPEGVSKLIGEMCEQMYFYVWFNEREGLVQIRAVRPAEDDEVTDLTGERNLLAGSVTWRDLTDELITQVWVHYGQIDPTEKLDEANNYSAIEVAVALDSQDSDKYGTTRIKKVFSRWIDAGNAAAAVDLGERVLARYSEVPRECSFTVDAKDGALWLGDFIRVQNRLVVDELGNEQQINLQIFQAEEAQIGTHFKYVAQQFIAASGDLDPNVRNVIISSDLLNVNLRSLHDSQLGALDGDETVTFTIRSGVVVGGDTAGGGENVSVDVRLDANDTYDAGDSSVNSDPIGQIPILQREGIVSVRTTLVDAAYAPGGTANWEIQEYPLSVAIDTGVWPVGVTVNLIIEPGAMVLGEGGNGSAHSLKEIRATEDTDPNTGNLVSTPEQLYRDAVNGGDGGHALKIQNPINITNGGVIGGGGGGGASVTSTENGTPTDNGSNPGIVTHTGGGGGGSLGSKVVTNIDFVGSPTPLTSAAGGSNLSGGVAATSTRQILEDVYINTIFLTKEFNSHRVNTADAPASDRGDGGGLAEAGSDATLVIVWRGVPLTYDFDSGGLAGDAILSGVNDITWVNKGDVRGAENV